MEQKKRIGLPFFFESWIRENRLFEAGARILAGVSGGPDSMALLSLLCELRPRWELDVQVLHCHHGLRPEADEEAEFVRTRAERWGCTYRLSLLPVKERHKDSGRSLQDVARELRYQAFQETAEKIGADHIALGHTADDQAEEILIGLIRGAGLGGLAGMPLKRGPFIRPLLRIYRTEILLYLAERGIPFREDPSNRDFRYLRARVRHHLIPELKKYSPNILAQLNRTARLLQEDESFLQEKTEETAAELIRRSGGGIEIPRGALAALPQALGSRLLQKALGMGRGHVRGIGAVHICSILYAVQGPRKEGAFALPGAWSALFNEETLRLIPEVAMRKPSAPFCYRVDGPGTLRIAETGDRIYFRNQTEGPFLSVRNPNPLLARVDGKKILWPLTVRSLRPGDRFAPLGMDGTKKVSRFLMDRKIPRWRRGNIPLILSGEEVVWIAGMEIDRRFALHQGSGPILEMEYRKGGLS